MRTEVRPATSSDAVEIIDVMQGSSRAEVDKVGDRLEVVVRAIEKASFAWAGFIDDKIVFLAGVETATLTSDVAYIWLITTEEAERHPFVFIRWSRVLLTELRSRYRIIHGHIDPAFTKSERWLRWLGFEMKGRDATGLRRFEMRAG